MPGIEAGKMWLVYVLSIIRSVVYKATVALSACLVVGLGIVSIQLFYNAFLHPLRFFPGPKLWAASRLPWSLYQYKGILYNRLRELHVKHGHVVRIGPNMISYTSGTAWKTIYGPRSSEMAKDPVFILHTPTGVQNLLTADRETHIRQRRLLSYPFSEKALIEQAGILHGHVDRLVNQLSVRHQAGPIDMAAWYNFITFDIIGDLSFGEDFGCLDQGKYTPFVRDIRSMATELTFMQILKYLGLSWLFVPKSVAGSRAKNMKFVIDQVDRRVKLQTERKDFLHYILRANDEKGMSMDEVRVNAFSFCIAGSESSATLLAGVTYYILTHPDIYKRLVDEIRTAYSSQKELMESTSHEHEYLEAVLTETLRMYPPVAGSLPRIVPPEGETIDGTFVPGGTSVAIHHFSTYRHPENFHLPNDFIPERWLPATRDKAPFDKDNRACLQPFSYGPRNCMGRSLAYAEMRLILVNVLWRFDLELVPGGEDWVNNQSLYGFWNKPPLMCKVSPVQRDAT